MLCGENECTNQVTSEFLTNCLLQIYCQNGVQSVITIIYVDL